MAKYISIPTTVTGAPSVTINTDLVTTVRFNSATLVEVWAFGKVYNFTVPTGTAPTIIAAINLAILNAGGPLLSNVVLPTGSVPTAYAVA